MSGRVSACTWIVHVYADRRELYDAKVEGDTYRFGEYELDLARHQLRWAGDPVHVEPRALDLLCHLVEHRDRVVSKNELILHSRDDERVPVSQANELASLIPDSRLVLLKSGNHLLTAFEPAWDEFLSHSDAFLTE